MMAPQQLLLPPAVSGERREFEERSGRLSYYAQGADHSASDHGDGNHPSPLLLVHSINAAGSAYEMRPLYEHYRGKRPVYTLELPGFGFSERSEREYTPRLMTDAILDMIGEIRRHHGDGPFDALALSLSCEFLARAALEEPDAFRSLALVSPTGFDSRGPYCDAPGSTRGKPWLYGTFTLPLWRKRFFKLLTSRRIIRYFLQKTWGSKQIDEGLLDYDYLTTHQPGAEHAPYYFVSGYLFSKDISRVYEALTLPIWMAHGTRGDFTDYQNKRRVQDAPNWSIDVFQTGALPHFEMLDAFTRGYDRFLTGVR